MSDEVKTCPNCGKTTAEYRKHMFTGIDPYVRDHGDWIQCKNCDYQGPPLAENGAESK